MLFYSVPALCWCITAKRKTKWYAILCLGCHSNAMEQARSLKYSFLRAGKQQVFLAKFLSNEAIIIIFFLSCFCCVIVFVVACLSTHQHTAPTTPQLAEEEKSSDSIIRHSEFNRSSFSAIRWFPSRSSCDTYDTPTEEADSLFLCVPSCSSQIPSFIKGT